MTLSAVILFSVLGILTCALGIGLLWKFDSSGYRLDEIKTAMAAAYTKGFNDRGAAGTGTASTPDWATTPEPKKYVLGCIGEIFGVVFILVGGALIAIPHAPEQWVALARGQIEKALRIEAAKAQAASLPPAFGKDPKVQDYKWEAAQKKLLLPTPPDGADHVVNFIAQNGTVTQMVYAKNVRNAVVPEGTERVVVFFHKAGKTSASVEVPKS